MYSSLNFPFFQIILAFSSTLIFSGCTLNPYAATPTPEVNIPSKLGLSPSPTPQVQGLMNSTAPDGIDSTAVVTPGESPKPNQQPASVNAKFAYIEVANKESSTGATFKVQLFPQIAPRTVANFEKKANSGYYDGLTFHRLEDWVVQGGDPKGDGTGGGTIRTELNKQPFIPGSFGMARGNDINYTNDSQFFIVLKQVFGLDEQYTNLGQLIEGAEIVAQIKKGDLIKSIRVR